MLVNLILLVKNYFNKKIRHPNYNGNNLYCNAFTKWYNYYN